MAGKLVLLNFKVAADLIVKLDERATALGVPRSEYCRQLLEAGLGTPAFDAQLKEVIYKLRPLVAEVLQRVTSEAIDTAVERIPEELRRIFPERLES